MCLCVSSNFRDYYAENPPDRLLCDHLPRRLHRPGHLLLHSGLLRNLLPELPVPLFLQLVPATSPLHTFLLHNSQTSHPSTPVSFVRPAPVHGHCERLRPQVGPVCVSAWNTMSAVQQGEDAPIAATGISRREGRPRVNHTHRGDISGDAYYSLH